MSLHSNALDSVEESTTLAAGTGLASPIAEIAAQPVPEPLTAAQLDAAPVAAAATVPATTVATVAAPTVATTVATPKGTAALGTLAPAATGTLPMIGALLLVVGLILALGKLVKRVQHSRLGAASPLALKGGVQVGAKERVVWMQAGETHLLLGVSPGRVQTLHVFDVAPDFSAPAANETLPTPATQEFSDRLKALLASARAKGVDVDVTPAVEAAVPPPAAKPAAKPAAAKPLFSFRA